jgi:hypothetical protein
MDTESYDIKNSLNFSFLLPILTVQSFLEQKHATELLNDELLDTATMVINNNDGEKSKKEVEVEVSKKNLAVEKILKTYSSGFFLLILLMYDKYNQKNINKRKIVTRGHKSSFRFNFR